MAGSTEGRPESESGRPRAGYRNTELNTIPSGIRQLRAKPSSPGQKVEVLSNFVAVEPMQARAIYKYRVDYEPELESRRARISLFHTATRDVFPARCIFDGMYDAQSSTKLASETTQLHAEHEGFKVCITIKQTGQVLWDSYELMRTYNMHMKSFLRTMGFVQVGKVNSYVHPAFSQRVGDSPIELVRGYNTSVNRHEADKVLVNFESVHKIIQGRNVLQLMAEIRQRSRGGRNLAEDLRAELVGKLVLTKYQRGRIYRIEDIELTSTPETTFHDDRADADVKIKDYFKQRYGVDIKENSQPLLSVVPNDKRRSERSGEQQGQLAQGATQGEGADKKILLVPELCNLAGLTDSQRTDFRIKRDLITHSQVPPAQRVSHLEKFLADLHGNGQVAEKLKAWGYSYARTPLSLSARVLPTETVCVGRFVGKPRSEWPKVDQGAGFDRPIISERIAKPIEFPYLAVLFAQEDASAMRQIGPDLENAMAKVGAKPNALRSQSVPNASASNFVQQLRAMPTDRVTAAMIIMPRQNKEVYDAIKKCASVERGLITQVVTTKLMSNPQKAKGAAVKIAIQLAAKIGCEPWYVHLPLGGTMFCGYDTYHDTTKRGRSFGAFLASMNASFSRWFSKADAHERIDELSSNMAQNMSESLEKYKSLNNGTYPTRVIVYRDGVGDGQLEHVYNVELKQLKEAIVAASPDTKLTFIVVNKRIGARFYMKQGNNFVNPPPGTIVDDVVTRRDRFDFYLVSQSTRHGTVAPTYYNIIFDENLLEVEHYQMMSYKLCLLYYNWTGSVRVPAPCQYAHKLAFICGEHLHAVPNATLDDRLHFL